MTSTNRKSSGVKVDNDAKRLHDPVTVVVSPAGNEYDADTWADANNYLGLGYSIKDGYPDGPEHVGPAGVDPTESPSPAAGGTAATQAASGSTGS